MTAYEKQRLELLRSISADIAAIKRETQNISTAFHFLFQDKLDGLKAESKPSTNKAEATCTEGM